MKILFITNMYPVEDYIYFGIHVKEQIEALRSIQKIESEVYFINGRESKLNYLKSVWEIKKCVKEGKYDVLHIHYGLSGLFLLFLKMNLPVVVTLHSGELFQKKGYINHLLQKSITLAIMDKVKKVVVLNDEMIQLLGKYKSKVYKLPCGIDLNLFKELPEKDSTELIRIGFPGNKVRKEKNFILFSSILDQLKVSKNIEVIEFHNMTRNMVVENLNKLDLLLMTSTVEGSPQIIKEAMACNIPVVSTAVGDVEDLLENVYNSYVVNSFDADNFIRPIQEIINLPKEERKSDGRDKLIQMGLDAQSVAQRIYELYNELV